MATKEELQAQADAEIEAAKPLYKQVNNDRLEFSDADYDQAKIDLGNSKWEEQQFGYISARQAAFPSIGDQLDMIYHAGQGGDEFQKAIKAVKDKYPKG